MRQNRVFYNMQPYGIAEKSAQKAPGSGSHQKLCGTDGACFQIGFPRSCFHQNRLDLDGPAPGIIFRFSCPFLLLFLLSPFVPLHSFM